MRRLIRWMFCAGLALGCGPRAQMVHRGGDVEAESPAVGSEFQVSLRIFVVTESGARAVADGETLHSGDRIYLSVRASQRAYLYAVLFGPDGTSNILFPDAAMQIAPGNCTIRIPQSGLLYLQSPTGTENLHVAASLRPLQQADRRLCEQLRLPCTQPIDESAVHPAACEKGEKSVIVGYKLARASPSGVVSLRMPFKHEP